MGWKICLSVRYVSLERIEEPARIRAAKVVCELFVDERRVYTSNENNGKVIKFPVVTPDRGFEDLAIHGWVKHECKTAEGKVIGIEYQTEYATKGELLGALRSMSDVALIPGDRKKPCQCYRDCLVELERLIKSDVEDEQKIVEGSIRESEERAQKIKQEGAEKIAALEKKYSDELKSLKAENERLRTIHEEEMQTAGLKIKALTAELQDIKSELKEKSAALDQEKSGLNIEVGKLKQALEEAKEREQRTRGELQSVRERLQEEQIARKAAEVAKIEAKDDLHHERAVRKASEFARREGELQASLEYERASRTHIEQILSVQLEAIKKTQEDGTVTLTELGLTLGARDATYRTSLETLRKQLVDTNTEWLRLEQARTELANEKMPTGAQSEVAPQLQKSLEEINRRMTLLAATTDEIKIRLIELVAEAKIEKQIRDEQGRMFQALQKLSEKLQDMERVSSGDQALLDDLRTSYAAEVEKTKRRSAFLDRADYALIKLANYVSFMKRNGKLP